MLLMYIMIAMYTVVSLTLIVVLYKLGQSIDNLYDLIKRRLPENGTSV